MDYRFDLADTLQAGCRVRVPLGNTTITAIVIELNVKSEFENLKPVLEVLDKEPVLDSSLLSLLSWASHYYFYPLGGVLFHSLPVLLRNGKALPKIQLWKASQSGRSDSLEGLKRAPKQRALLQHLIEGEKTGQQLQGVFGDTWRNNLRQLEKKALVEYREVDAGFVQSKQTDAIPAKQEIKLTQEQHDCVTEITDFFQQKQPKPVLLHGITGSGKTEVYLRVIDPVLAAGKQILVLVPEIGLTPQLLFRFKEHYPQYNIVSLHSAMANGARLQAWIGAKSGAVDIIIGTRSAVFTPMKDLGAVIIDEEHDASFKQQEGFLYQGRDMAIKRAYEASIPVLMGSATPSLESMQNVNLQRYDYLRLGSRPGKHQRPDIVIQDIRAQYLDAGISNLMMSEIRQHIENGHQVMLFLNRRGFAPVLVCPACGWHASCYHCDRGMTYHAAIGKVICHHCGADEAVKSLCPSCGSNKLTTQGQGTERVEQVLNTHFPDVEVIRVDRDSTSRKGSLEKKLQKVHAGDPVILIGTQMLTKGHDFPKLTLVGILDVDQALFSIDFRAQERLAQQVIQVAGRAGRGKEKGRVVLQTSQPEHPLLINLLSKGYYQTAREIMNERQLWHYPPFGAQALIRVSADSADAGNKFMSRLLLKLQKYEFPDIELLGPMPSPLPKRANRFRFQLLISSVKRGALHAALDKTLLLLISLRRTGGVRWVIDVDPVDFL